MSAVTIPAGLLKNLKDLYAEAKKNIREFNTHEDKDDKVEMPAYSEPKTQKDFELSWLLYGIMADMGREILNIEDYISDFKTPRASLFSNHEVLEYINDLVSQGNEYLDSVGGEEEEETPEDAALASGLKRMDPFAKWAS